MTIKKKLINAAGIGMLATSTVAGTSAKQPNFVLILVDDMGWTGTSALMDNRISSSRSDYYFTPNIAMLAKNGVTFCNAYSASPLCTPSRASILTGKTPARLHMTSPGPPGRPAFSWQKVVAPPHTNSLPEKEITIAEMLKRKKYATAHFGKWHLSGGGPGKHGFDQHDGSTGNDSFGYNKASNPKDIFGITKRANAFIDQSVKNGKPFYVQLSHYALHEPIEALSSTLKECSKRPSGKHHSDAKYAAMTQDVDTSIGLVLKKIKQMGVEKNTYIIVTSDNGAGRHGSRNENYPLYGSKGTLYEGGIRGPLIIRGPGIKSGTYIRENVVGCDLFPTICGLAGLKKVPDDIDGTSILPLLRNETNNKFSNRPLIFYFPHYGMGPRQKPQAALIQGRYKLLEDLESGRTKLFDLSRDIGERYNISTRARNTANRMENELHSYLKQVNASLPTPNKNYNPNAPRRRSRKMR